MPPRPVVLHHGSGDPSAKERRRPRGLSPDPGSREPGPKSAAGSAGVSGAAYPSRDPALFRTPNTPETCPVRALSRPSSLPSATVANSGVRFATCPKAVSWQRGGFRAAEEGGRERAVGSSEDYLLVGGLKKKKEETIISDLLNNGYTRSFIQRIARRQRKSDRRLRPQEIAHPRSTTRVCVP